MLISPANAELIYVAADSVYTQDFNSLPNSGADLAWTNSITLGGWYSSSSLITAAAGDSSDETLYSFGSNGSSERALGIVSEGLANSPQFAIAIRNNTGATLNSFNVRFDGEQWRISDTNQRASQLLSFGYRTSTNLGAMNTATYTNVASLGFTSPEFLLQGGPVDGNNSANRLSNITGSINGLDWKQGEYLWLRWANEANGSLHGLGIDNFSFSASAGNVTAVPEPSSLLLLATFGWIALRLQKRVRTRD